MISLQFKGLLRAPQSESINSSVFSLLYCPNLISIRDCRKNYSFDYVMSLLFDILSRLVIAFFPRSKRLLISWLQSPGIAIIEDYGREIFTLLSEFSLNRGSGYASIKHNEG